MDPKAELTLSPGAHIAITRAQTSPPGGGVLASFAPESASLGTKLLAGTAGARPLEWVEVELQITPPPGHKFDRVFLAGWTMIDRAGPEPFTGPAISHGTGGWCDSQTNLAVVCGVTDLGRVNLRIESSPTPEGSIMVRLRFDLESLANLSPDFTLPDVIFSAGIGLFDLLAGHAKHVADRAGATVRPRIETGWCSWYYYYGQETFADLCDNIDQLASSPLAPHLRTIQIDDGWNRPAGLEPPTRWGDWHPHPDKFPDGMESAVARIRNAGFAAGLWLAPFSVSRDSEIFRDHPGWLVQRKTNDHFEPAPDHNPNVFQLDTTHPEATAWLTETINRVCHVWGFTYLKIDFLIHGARPGQRFDSTCTSIAACRRGMEIIRQAAGPDVFILACGAPFGAAIGLCDGMRIGADVGNRWSLPLNWPGWPYGNCSVYAAAVPAIWCLWMHRRWWQNDADCLVVRSEPNEHDLRCDSHVRSIFNAPTANCPIPESALGLSDEEAGFWTRLLWLSGSMLLLSEVWANLPPERKSLVEGCFPLNHDPVVWLDNYRDLRWVALLANRPSPLFGVFNLSDDAIEPVLASADLLLPSTWHLRERWSGEQIAGTGPSIRLPILPPRSARIWETESLQRT